MVDDAMSWIYLHGDALSLLEMVVVIVLVAYMLLRKPTDYE